jgi:beta-lactam-binding protein with PASTA domain
MPASDARAQLERAGLKFARAEAAVGTPGQVLWTRPAIGSRVPSDTPVTIVVGVDAGRFVLGASGL